MKRTIMTHLYQVAYWVSLAYYFIFRPVTMGVKVLLIQDETVLLLQHTYKAGWYLPGGGLKRGETLVEAARREAAEEVGATLTDIELFGVYSNLAGHKSDHITLFLSRSFSLTGERDYEIKNCAFFPLDQLPADIGAGSRRRIEEYQQGLSPRFAVW